MNRNDKLLIAGMLIAAALFFIGFRYLNRAEGSSVAVIVDGAVTARLPLSADGKYKVDGLIGESVILIQGGKVSMEYAPCPDQICVRHRRIQYNGEQIVCLPGRIILEIEGAQEGEIDGIAR